MKNVFAFLFGSMFAVGLILSGMVDPKKVLDFLDLFGDWDASLAFVMMGTITVAFIPFQKAVRHPELKTVFNEAIQLPKNSKIDIKLIIGSLIFGIGWGMAGICLGPSLTLIGLGYNEGLYFIIAMLVGVFLHKKWSGV